jgi:hypothetical protein
MPKREKRMPPKKKRRVVTDPTQHIDQRLDAVRSAHAARRLEDDDSNKSIEEEADKIEKSPEFAKKKTEWKGLKLSDKMLAKALAASGVTALTVAAAKMSNVMRGAARLGVPVTPGIELEAPLLGDPPADLPVEAPYNPAVAGMRRRVLDGEPPPPVEAYTPPPPVEAKVPAPAVKLRTRKGWMDGEPERVTFPKPPKPTVGAIPKEPIKPRGLTMNNTQQYKLKNPTRYAKYMEEVDAWDEARHAVGFTPATRTPPVIEMQPPENWMEQQFSWEDRYMEHEAKVQDFIERDLTASGNLPAYRRRLGLSADASAEEVMETVREMSSTRSTFSNITNFPAKMIQSMAAKGGLAGKFGRAVMKNGKYIKGGFQIGGAALAVVGSVFEGQTLAEIHKARNAMKKYTQAHPEDKVAQEFLEMQNAGVRRHDAYFGVNTAVTTGVVVSTGAAIAGAAGVEGGVVAGLSASGPVGWVLLGLGATAMGVFAIVEDESKKAEYKGWMTKHFSDPTVADGMKRLAKEEPEMFRYVDGFMNHTVPENATKAERVWWKKQRTILQSYTRAEQFKMEFGDAEGVENRWRNSLEFLKKFAANNDPKVIERAMHDLRLHPSWNQAQIDRQIGYRKERKSLDDAGLPDPRFMSVEEAIAWRGKTTKKQSFYRNIEEGGFMHGRKDPSLPYLDTNHFEDPFPGLFMEDGTEEDDMYSPTNVGQTTVNNGITNRDKGDMGGAPETDGTIYTPHQDRPGSNALHPHPIATQQSGTIPARNGETMHGSSDETSERHHTKKTNPETGVQQYTGIHKFQRGHVITIPSQHEKFHHYDNEAYPQAYDPNHNHIGGFGAGDTPQVAPGGTRDIGSHHSTPTAKSKMTMDRLRAMYSIDHGVTNQLTMASTGKRNFMASKARTRQYV